MTTWLRVKNWDRFQHYTDRCPPWIKLHYSTLDDYEWSHLPDASKAHLVGIWLLASRNHGRVPADAAWLAKRMGATVRIDLALLLRAGFLEQDASEPPAPSKQDASEMLDLEEERRGEERREEKEKKKRREETESSASSMNGDAIHYCQVCTAAANKGLQEALGPAFRELVSANQTGIVSEWAEIPLDIAARAIYERAKTYKPTATRKQPTGLQYFRQVVLEAWDRDRNRGIPVPASREKPQAGPSYPKYRPPEVERGGPLTPLTELKAKYANPGGNAA